MRDVDSTFKCKCGYEDKLSEFAPTTYSSEKKDYIYMCPSCGEIEKIKEVLE